jgi:hypothetical protein
MEELFNIDDVIIIKNTDLKKYKIIKINKKTFKCINEKNDELLIKKNNVDFEKYYSTDDDVVYYVMIKYLNSEYEYEYKTMNLLFDKLSEYYEISDILKKQIYDNISTNDYHYEHTTSNNTTYSNVKINIYKVDVSDNYTSELKCTCQSGFKGFGAFCKKHND